MVDLSRTQVDGAGDGDGAAEKGQDAEAWTAMEIELARLRSLLAAKDEETAQLSLANVELRTRLKEEAAAMATSLEEQRILESRLLEAEANLDQMMRALAAAKDTAATSTSSTSNGGRNMGAPQEEASVRAAESPVRQRSVAGNEQPFSPRSPSVQQVYEEKLQSVEKVCSFLQVKCVARCVC